jgi:hypothetical protein
MTITQTTAERIEELNDVLDEILGQDTRQPRITVRYTSVDGARIVRTYKTLAGARRFAVDYVGEYPGFGFGYAISDDGIGKIEVSGCTLRQLFGTEG